MAAPSWAESRINPDYPVACDEGAIPDPVTNPDGDPGGDFVECPWTGYLGDLLGYGELDIVEDCGNRIVGRCPKCGERIVVWAR